MKIEEKLKELSFACFLQDIHISEEKLELLIRTYDSMMSSNGKVSLREVRLLNVEVAEKYACIQEKKDKYLDSVLGLISVRCHNALKEYMKNRTDSSVITLDNLRVVNLNEFNSIRRIGAKSLAELEVVINKVKEERPFGFDWGKIEKC